VERLILINLERARALPAQAAARSVVVDVPAAELAAYGAGLVELRMKVAVGQPSMPTPVMAGIIRHAVVNPYWNVPVDLTRDRFAPRALVDPHVLEREGFEVLDDWSPDADRLPTAAVNWGAVAAGDSVVRLRQKPGPNNMMGRVKFMFPNRLGIYLHDTPDRSVFARSGRAVSAGCVRVADADALARWLFGRDPLAASAGPETIVPVARTVPVYILYLTARRGAAGEVAIRRDIYGLDEPAIRRLEQVRGRVSRQVREPTTAA
jgi:murein L,D-transpeptidase YcbB/YkuD